MDDFQHEPALSDDPLLIEEGDNIPTTRSDPEGAAFVVDLLFKCALNRAPDTKALEAYTMALVSGTHTPDDVVAELRDSDEARRLRFQEITRDLAFAIYPAVFGRDPDEIEATRLIKNLERDSLKASFSDLLLSAEALRYQLKIITQRLGIGAILLSQASADREVKAETKTSA